MYLFILIVKLKLFDLRKPVWLNTAVFQFSSSLVVMYKVFSGFIVVFGVIYIFKITAVTIMLIACIVHLKNQFHNHFSLVFQLKYIKVLETR